MLCIVFAILNLYTPRCEDVEFRLDVDASQLNLTTCMDFDFTQLSFFRNPVRGVAVPTMEYSYLPVVADSLSQSYHEDEEGVGWHSGGAVGVYVSTVNRPGNSDTCSE